MKVVYSFLISLLTYLFFLPSVKGSMKDSALRSSEGIVLPSHGLVLINGNPAAFSKNPGWHIMTGSYEGTGAASNTYWGGIGYIYENWGIALGGITPDSADNISQASGLLSYSLDSLNMICGYSFRTVYYNGQWGGSGIFGLLINSGGAWQFGFTINDILFSNYLLGLGIGIDLTEWLFFTLDTSYLRGLNSMKATPSFTFQAGYLELMLGYRSHTGKQSEWIGGVGITAFERKMALQFQWNAINEHLLAFSLNF